MFAETVNLQTFSEVIFQMFAVTVATVQQLAEFKRVARSQQLAELKRVARSQQLTGFRTVATVQQLAEFKAVTRVQKAAAGRTVARSQKLAALQTIATVQKFAVQVSENFHCAKTMHVLAVMFTICMSFFSLTTSSTTCVVLQIHTGLICTMSCTVIP
jgi:hypothetical protein